MTRVLVVDSDATSRLLVESALRRENFEIVSVPNGGSAWAVLQSPQPPRLVVVNWELPDLSGPDLVRRLRARPGGADAWVLMVSARERREDRLAAFDAGVNDYVAKPADPIELRARARAAARLVTRIEDLEQFERIVRRTAA